MARIYIFCSMIKPIMSLDICFTNKIERLVVSKPCFFIRLISIVCNESVFKFSKAAIRLTHLINQSTQSCYINTLQIIVFAYIISIQAYHLISKGVLIWNHVFVGVSSQRIELKILPTRSSSGGFLGSIFGDETKINPLVSHLATFIELAWIRNIWPAS